MVGEVAGLDHGEYEQQQNGGGGRRPRRLLYMHLCMQQPISPSSVACPFPALTPFLPQLLKPNCHAVLLLQVPQAPVIRRARERERDWRQVRLGWWAGEAGGGLQNWPEAAKVGEGSKGGWGREVRAGEQGQHAMAHAACLGRWAEHGSSRVPNTGHHTPVS
jgi:hypothetical protein